MTRYTSKDKASFIAATLQDPDLQKILKTPELRTMEANYIWDKLPAIYQYIDSLDNCIHSLNYTLKPK